MNRRHERGRWGRIARRALRISAWVALLLVVIVAAVAVGINTPWARRQLVTRVNLALADSFEGTLRLQQVGRVGLGGVSGVHALVLDRARRPVLEVLDLSVGLEVLPLAWDLVVARPRDLSIVLDSVELKHARVELVDAGGGVPTLATAFSPRVRGEPSQGTTTVRIARGYLRHVWAHGRLSGTLIDADVADLEATLEVNPNAFELEVGHAKLRARALPSRVDPQGDLAGTLGIPLGNSRAPLVVQARFDGNAWGTPTTARAGLRGRAIDARIALPSLSPDQIGRWLPGSELRTPAALRATVTGTLDRPELSARARLGAGGVEAKLLVDTVARTLNAGVELHRLDLSLLDGGLSPSALSATLSATGKYTETRELSLATRVRLGDSEFAGYPLPVTEGEGTFELGHAETTAPVPWRARGKLRIEEPGAPSTLDYEADANAGDPSVRVSSVTTLDHPARLAELVPGLGVRGRVQSQTRLSLGSRRLWLDARASLPELRTPSASAERVELSARAEGAIARPELAIEAKVARLAVGKHVYRQGRLRASGTSARLRLDARTDGSPEVAAGAFVSLEPELSVTEGTLRVGSGDRLLTASVASVRLAQHRVAVEDVRLRTPSGWARASFELDRGLRSLRLEARDFDVSEAAAAWRLERSVPRGIVTADARFDREPKGTARVERASGFLEAGVKGFGYGPVDDAQLNLSVRLERGFLAGSFGARWQDSAASLNLDGLPVAAAAGFSSAELAGRLTGQASVELEDLGPLIELGLVPLEVAEGHAELDFRVEKRPRDLARLEAKLETSRLRLVGEREELDRTTTEAARRAAPWSLTGTDVELGVAFDQATRELSLDATLTDAKGKLARLETDARWPRDAAELPLARWPALWQRVETTAQLWLLPRKLSDWPSSVAPSTIDGTAALSVHAVGSFQNPSLRWMARLEDFGPPDEPHRDLDLMASGDYRPDAGSARLAVAAHDRQVAEVEAEWRGDVVRHLTTGTGPATGHVRGELDRFPVGALPLLASERLAGHLSGDFEVEKAAAWQGQIELESNDFSVARIAADRLRLQASLREGWLDASLGARGRQLGSIDAELSGRAPVAPNARGSAGLQAKLRASKFQLKSLAPLVAGSLSGLEGVLDAELAGEVSSENPNLRGHLEVSKGAAQLPALGQTLHSIKARVEVDQDRVELGHFEARGLTGRLKGRGSARLDGLSLRSAEASVAIAEREKVPLTLRGVTLGDAWGSAAVRYRPIDERRRRLDVDIAQFNLELPDVSPPGVQSLEPAAHIEVGHETRAGKFVEIPLQPIEREPAGEPQRWIIAVNLGKIEVHKGPGIAIGLEGQLKARVGRKTRLSGRIDLTGGKLDVSGKEFKIERGALTWDRAEVEQGVVTATARWDSPAEYSVYAEYSGTVEQGELKLRSEPPLTQDEVLGLLMFGTPGGTFGAREKDEAATAVGLAGGTVAKGLNHALSDLTSLDVSTRVDTSTGEARPELVLQISPRATARVTQAIGEAPPGQSPDRTFLTVDLRLFKRWSLSAQVGDEGGSSLDLIWRHRY